jgi:flap endonuclease-1
MGMLYRNLFFLQNGVKACWVFDGIPPTAKINTLKKRQDSKDYAKEIVDLNKSEPIPDKKEILKYSKRSVMITKQMKNDAMELIKLLGLPFIQVL